MGEAPAVRGGRARGDGIARTAGGH